MRLSLIIPAYNEEQKIIRTLTEYISFLRQQFGESFEIIVVANGCQDQTAKVVREFQLNNPEVVLIEDALPRKGRAVHLGFEQARGEWVSFVDADNAVPVAEWQKLFLALNGAEAAIASRFLPNSTVFNRTWFRKLAGQLFSIFVRILFNLPLVDTQCGAKIIKASALTPILKDLTVTNMAFDVQLLWLLHRRGAKIREIPITWRGAANGAVASPIKFIKQTFKMVWSLLIIRLFS
ncbi:MAG: glycosyltransferase [Candidatus Komeilibacteria bacterium]|nr:glycosyltransferase [Candidatus Komeilibacteria bacterium]